MPKLFLNVNFLRKCSVYFICWSVKKILARGEVGKHFFKFFLTRGEGGRPIYRGMEHLIPEDSVITTTTTKMGTKVKIQIVTNSKSSLWLYSKSKFFIILTRRYGPLRRTTSSFGLQPRLFFSKKEGFFSSVLADFLKFVVVSSNLGNF